MSPDLRAIPRLPLVMPETTAEEAAAVAIAQIGAPGPHIRATAAISMIFPRIGTDRSRFCSPWNRLLKAGRDGRVRALEARADERAAHHQVLVPLRGRGLEQLRVDAEHVEVERYSLGCILLEARVVGVVREEQGARALRDRARLVVGRVGDGAPEPGSLVAVEV